MKRKYGYIFILMAIMILAISSVSAYEDNSTDIIQEIEQDETITVSNSAEKTLENSSNIEESTNDSSSAVETEVINQTGSADNGNSTAPNLKIMTYTNFVKNGKYYTMYLTDLKGNGIANKNLNVTLDGKTYTKTTVADGKFTVLMNSTNSIEYMNISYIGNSEYSAFCQTMKVYIENTLTITIGNTKLLTNGYLRIYLKNPSKSVTYKYITITIGNKEFVKKTNAEGFVVIKPQVSAGTYTITVKYNNYTVSKKIKCIKGNVIDPLKKAIPLVNGVPDIDRMPENFVMADNDAKYTLKKYQYREAIKRDSYCLYLYGKLTKYTYFKTKTATKYYHVIKREKWNVIERALNTKLVKSNKYNYWPETITANLKGKSYTYSEVRDVQNTEYTCGPTSASMCSQALRKYSSEKYFQVKANVKSGVNFPVLKRVLDKNNFKTNFIYSMDTAVKELKKGGAAVIAYLKNHYVSVIDVSKDGKKILVSNSYGKYNVGGDTKVPTKWVTLKYFKSKFKGIGLVVKLNYKLSNTVKKQMKCFQSSMGGKWTRQNTNERIPDVPI